MTLALRSLAAFGLALGLACHAPPTHGPGGPCRSLSDCQSGLACYEGRCTSDLSGLASQTAPPPYTTLPDAAEPMSAEGGRGPDAAGPAVIDASHPASTDAGRRDGG